MSEMDPKDKGKATPPSAPIFVPKQEDKVELTLDEALLMIADLYRKSAPLVKQIKNLKNVAKAHMKAQGKKRYEMMDGTTAQFISKQASKINKELAKEICGKRWAEVEKFVEEVSFKVSVPGVKSPDAD